MLDLDREAVLDWAGACAPMVLARGTAAIRDVEDVPEIRESLVALGQALEVADTGRLAEVSAINAVRTVLTQLGPARLLRVLRWLEGEGGDGRRAVLTEMLRGPHPDALALRAALDTLNRHELLARIFAPQRVEELIAAITIAKKEIAS